MALALISGINQRSGCFRTLEKTLKLMPHYHDICTKSYRNLALIIYLTRDLTGIHAKIMNWLEVSLNTVQ